MRPFTHQDVRELPCTVKELGPNSDWMEVVYKLRLDKASPLPLCVIIPILSVSFWLREKG